MHLSVCNLTKIQTRKNSYFGKYKISLSETFEFWLRVPNKGRLAHNNFKLLRYFMPALIELPKFLLFGMRRVWQFVCHRLLGGLKYLSCDSVMLNMSTNSLITFADGYAADDSFTSYLKAEHGLVHNW